MTNDGQPTGAELIAAIEEQLRDLADQFHDHLCQPLAAASPLVALISRAVARHEPVAPEQLARLQTAISAAIDQARMIGWQLAPPDLRGAGLLSGLETLAQQANCQFVCERAVLLQDPGAALVLFRSAQDGLRCLLPEQDGSVRLVLTRTAEVVRLELHARLRESAVMNLIRCRVLEARGAFELFSAPRNGFAVAVGHPAASGKMHE